MFERFFQRLEQHRVAWKTLVPISMSLKQNRFRFGFRLRNTLAAELLFLCGSLWAAESVTVDFFFEPGCRDCERIEAELLPEIERRFPDDCVVYAHDIGLETNFLYLLQLEDELGYAEPERAYLIVNKEFLFGSSPSKEDVLSLISELAERGSEPRKNPAPKLQDDSKSSESSVVKERFGRFTFGAVVIAGLLDGLNPCAISTLIFFMSLLAVSKVRNREMLLLGLSFCIASFVTYLALGFGLLRILHLFAGFKLIRAAIEWGMITVLLVLAVLSLRDAFRFRRSHDGRDVTLQLSINMKKRIHRVMRRGVGTGSVVLGGFLTGTAVTALESVCTGQVYVPTLVLILKSNLFSEPNAWLYLLAYNLLFVLPLVLTFIAVYFGLRTETLLRWSEKNVILSKTLLGLFFISMALLVFWI